MSRRLLALLALFVLPLPAAADAPGRDLAAALLADTGTAAVFAAPAVQAALADPHPFLGDAARARRARLLDEAGFRAWQPPRAWVLELRREGEQEQWLPVAPALAARAEARGYRFVTTPPAADAAALMSRFVPGQAAPGLEELLAAEAADVLVLVRGREWGLWTHAATLRGSLPQPAVLPELIAELLAAGGQWPAAAGRAVLQVEGVGGMADLVAIRGVLQALPALRGAQLLRAAPGRLWFAVPLEPAALGAALAGEPRLAALPVPTVLPGQPATALQALRQASPLLVRRWQPGAAAPASPSSLP